MSLDNFQCIKLLAKGGFGTVVLAKGKLPGGPEEQYAIKALKKTNRHFHQHLSDLC